MTRTLLALLLSTSAVMAQAPPTMSPPAPISTLPLDGQSVITNYRPLITNYTQRGILVRCDPPNEAIIDTNNIIPNDLLQALNKFCEAKP